MIPDYPTPQLSTQLRNLWKLAFGDDDVFLDHFFSTGFSEKRCRCMVSDGVLAAALYWFDAEYQGEKYAYLYAVATHPDFRHQGLLHYLLADTHQLLTSLGYAGAMLVPGSEELRGLYTSIGYRTCTGICSLFSASQPVTVPIHSVDWQEYQKLRREYLPAGGLLQEEDSLRFLQTQAKFYTGPGFLLCAAPESTDLMRGIEFLGDTAVVPGILCALGYSHGNFRTPGDKIPFAMIYPLKKDAPVPGYLGLAFD